MFTHEMNLCDWQRLNKEKQEGQCYGLIAISLMAQQWYYHDTWQNHETIDISQTTQKKKNAGFFNPCLGQI